MAMTTPQGRPTVRPELPVTGFRMYGLNLRSDWPLEFGVRRRPEPGYDDVTITRSTQLCGSPAQGSGEAWFHFSALEDGGVRLRWPRFFEFDVSADGRRIDGRELTGEAVAAFEHFLLARVLSFALIALGRETLHGTASAVGGRAACFVGDCGYGKSSLAAAFLVSGHPLVTDDLMSFKQTPAGFSLYAGPPRLKLFPDMAARLLWGGAVGVRVNSLATKRAFVLSPAQTVSEDLPVSTIYVLDPPEKLATNGPISITPMSPAAAQLALVENTFNTVVRTRARLRRQFEFAESVAKTVTVRKLCYPRSLEALPLVVDAVRMDLGV